MNKTIFLRLDGITYSESLSIQERLQKRLVLKEADCMYLLFVDYNEHIFTQGKNGRKENLLITDKESEKLGIKVIESDRGGDITYHGPGQLVCYPIFDLKKLRFGVKKFVAKIEELIVAYLNELKINSKTLEKKPGVWVSDKKIASVGLNVKRHITKHGFSLNINNDLSYYQYINPCGYEGLKVTSISQELANSINMNFCQKRLIYYFENLFNITIEKQSLSEVLDSPFQKVL